MVAATDPPTCADCGLDRRGCLRPQAQRATASPRTVVGRMRTDVAACSTASPRPAFLHQRFEETRRYVDACARRLKSWRLVDASTFAEHSRDKRRSQLSAAYKILDRTRHKVAADAQTVDRAIHPLVVVRCEIAIWLCDNEEIKVAVRPRVASCAGPEQPDCVRINRGHDAVEDSRKRLLLGASAAKVRANSKA